MQHYFHEDETFYPKLQLKHITYIYTYIYILNIILHIDPGRMCFTEFNYFFKYCLERLILLIENVMFLHHGNVRTENNVTIQTVLIYGCSISKEIV